MYTSDKQVSEFYLEGKIIEILNKEGRPKVIKLLTSSGLFWIKLSKHAEIPDYQVLLPGKQIQVTGKKKLDLKTAKLKLKAYQVQPLETNCEAIPSTPTPPVSNAAPCSKPQGKILVCQKSDCKKRGGQAVCAALQQALSHQGLEEHVKVEATGCLKRCKDGPNLVMLPDKTRYTNVQPEKIPALIAKFKAEGRGQKAEV